MSSNPKMLPPFRDSALTRILKSVFLNNNKATIIVNIDPSTEWIEESMNTIRFARYAKRVKTKVIRKDHQSTGSLGHKKTPAHLQEEIKMLKERLVLQSHLSQPLRILRGDQSTKDLKAGREREMMKARYDNRLLKEVMDENSRLKKEIQLLVERQTKSLKGNSVAGFNEEGDSTNSGIDEILQHM
jgi:hypothetical protein